MNYFILLALLFVSLTFFIFWMFLEKSKSSLKEEFKSASFDVMEKNSQNFFSMIKLLMDNYQSSLKKEADLKEQNFQAVFAPLKDSLNKMEEYTKSLEKQRESSFASLNKQLETLLLSEENLRKETFNLSKALRSPNISGSWGQIHLKRVVELSGLLNQCDFFEEKSVRHDEKGYRPDLVIHLPGKRHIVVDAKTPLDAYLEMEKAEEDKKNEMIKEHLLRIKRHIKELSKKEYFKLFDLSADFVILFLPTEAFLSVALNFEPTLLEEAARHNIIIATPSTLIAMLKAIAYAWKQDSLATNAKEVIKLASELSERMKVMNAHFARLGKNIASSVESYNQTVASMEARVLVSARKLKEMGLSPIDENEEKANQINTMPRSILASEQE